MLQRGRSSTRQPQWPTLAVARELLAVTARQLDGLGLWSARCASLGLRLGEGQLVLIRGGQTRPDQTVVAPVAGPEQAADDELAPAVLLHAAVLRAVASADAVLHARPVGIAALGLSGITPARCLLDEPCASLGDPPASLEGRGAARFGAADLGVLVGDLAAEAGAVLIGGGRYGVVVCGAEPQEVLARLRRLESVARVTLAARAINSPPPISERQAWLWQRLASELDWADAGSTDGCAACNACENGHLVGQGRAGEVEQGAIATAIDGLLDG